MNRISVRARLTGLVVVVAFVLGVVAATIGIDRVESTLVDDELDTAAAEQLGTVEEVLAIAGEFQIFDAISGDEVFFVDEFSVQAEIENVSFALSELVDSEVLDTVVGESGHDDGSPVPILTYFGQVLLFDADELTLDGPVAVDDATGTIVPQIVLDEVLFAVAEFDADDVFELDDDSPDDEGELEEADDGLRFDTRALDGGSYLVVADVSDIDRGLDRIRTIVWTSVPLLVLLGGVIAWLLTGRALGPVHAITRQVEEISSGNLHERVPEPATGDEIAELAVTMNSMLDRLEVDDRRLRRFVSDASHELRSPVAVLRSEAEVAKRAPDGTTVESLADGVLAESSRLQRIVEDLLVLARGEERSASRPVEVDVDDIVLREAARRRALPVDTRSVSAGRVAGTPEAVGRIVTHLLDNAARHGASRVEVGLTAADGTVTLWVDDDGPGVPVAERGRIFERFARLDDARSRDRGGAGLGLAVVAESVRSMGGEVAVEDAPLGGARFRVRWPVT